MFYIKVKRAVGVLIGIWLILLALVFRIYYISCGNLQQKVSTTAGSRSASNLLYNSKGVIYDRNLVALSGLAPCYYLVVNPRYFDKTQTDYLAFVSNVKKDTILTKLNKETPFVLYSYQKPIEIKGVTVFEGTTRYAEDRVCEHLLGYLDSEQNVGLSGIEKSYNDFLSDFSSKTTFSYTANALRGAIPYASIDANKSTDSDSGIITTLDSELCKVAERSLKKHTSSGCVVVMDCNNGQILAMSSTPGYDENDILQYKDSKSGELTNLALVNQTVGSVFKMVLACAAILEGIDNFEYECSGAINISNHTFTCQDSVSHSKQTLTDAFSNSCNCYFISLGQLLGYDKIKEYCLLFGLDSSIKIAKDFYAKSGNIPKNEGAVALANLSIGQGNLMLSPLCVARLTALMANGGYLVNPTIYKGTYINQIVSNEPSYSYKNNVLNKDAAQKIKDLFIYCVQNGTGKSAMPNSNGAGGKTASAQTGVYENKKEVLNTYFTGFYPAQNPEYVITVFAKNGQSGSKTCAPVFKEICDFIN